MPERIGRLLTLVQFLIGYGKECAATLRQQAVTPQFRLTMQARFGTSDLARILIRIGRALKLAAALDTRLRQLAVTGQDIKTQTELARVSPSTLASRSTTTADRRAAGSGTVPDTLDDDLPSEAQIVAMIRRGKTGAVIAEICRGLGLVPGVVSPQQWSEVHHAIITFGGKFAKLLCDILFRIQGCVAAAVAANAALSSAAIRDLEHAIFAPPAPA